MSFWKWLKEQKRKSRRKNTPKPEPVQPEPEPETEPETIGGRSFYMGCTGFPPDTTASALASTKQFAKDHTDIICLHIDGVPWAEMNESEGLPEKMVNQIQSKLEMKVDGGKVFLSLLPGRGSLQVHSASRGLPAGWGSKKFDDAEVVQAYLRYCYLMIELVDPDWLCLGIEANENEGEWWDSYVILHNSMYGMLRKDHPSLPMFASLTLHTMANRPKSISKLDDIENCNDYVAISYYPFMRGDQGRRNSFRIAEDLAERWGKPITIAETGDTAEVTKAGKNTFYGSEKQQAEYLNALISFVVKHESPFLIWFIHQDYDGMWDRLGSTMPVLFKFWKDCGLLDGVGLERKSFRIWDLWQKIPVDSK